MRTTIDIPEELLRRVRATAAMRGVKLKDFVANILEQGLSEGPADGAAQGQRRPIPVAVGSANRTIPALTNAELEELFLRQDVEQIGARRSA